MATKTERISARVDEEVFETLKRAASLVGSTVCRQQWNPQKLAEKLASVFS